ncbi:LBP_cg2779 family protein [Lentilactobacillus sp. Marseille-Q4993]|uniref:LBP_cg2779 family protein n=1 Tax=Lentilactobacillus sp. Marseille-Q4993 TaxID=3039492 RepID=UPI0024BC4149|nr:LBP_cg2779 family protein [Lentilactobacillus sp. Marseille-Q4993]
MGDQFSNIAEEIIHYQKKHDMPDTQLAFNLHISVERLHSIKSMESDPTNEELTIIQKFVR